jgi:hypothetical protein
MISTKSYLMTLNGGGISVQFVGVLLMILSIFSCDSKENWSGIGNEDSRDTLFLGLYLGMTETDFSDQCMKLNKQKLVTQGLGPLSVEHKLLDDFESPVTMRFFPTFIEEKIFEVPVTYNFAAWAPWNKQYQSNVLLEKLLEKYKLWYGDDFQLINHQTQGKVYWKIDGKRRINLFIMDDQHVQAVFTDLKVEKELKEEYRKKLEQ